MKSISALKFLISSIWCTNLLDNIEKNKNDLNIQSDDTLNQGNFFFTQHIQNILESTSLSRFVTVFDCSQAFGYFSEASSLEEAIWCCFIQCLKERGKKLQSHKCHKTDCEILKTSQAETLQNIPSDHKEIQKLLEKFLYRYEQRDLVKFIEYISRATQLAFCSDFSSHFKVSKCSKCRRCSKVVKTTIFDENFSHAIALDNFDWQKNILCENFGMCLPFLGHRLQSKCLCLINIDSISSEFKLSTIPPLLILTFEDWFKITEHKNTQPAYQQIPTEIKVKEQDYQLQSILLTSFDDFEPIYVSFSRFRNDEWFALIKGIYLKVSNIESVLDRNNSVDALFYTLV
ncbi:hypothetical protein M153_910000205 [Pseudoloma neurophilia]|uniref:Uncharacterized protein n=1 Tax=Pseudoloma neurophilia TaxID=146866 RepID=A0A0R0LVI0_9MICR|nr:hypothetical protein M153_910000205 [Pseudoloma neurophilia]